MTLLLAVILGAAVSPVRGQTVTVLNAVADAHTENGTNQFLNFGTEDEIQMGSVSVFGPLLHAFVRYDVSAIPAGAIILNGSLRIYAFDQALGFVDTEFYLVTGSWGETTINWSNEPSRAATPDYVYSQDTSEPGAGFHTYEITTLVQSWVDGPNYGMVMLNDSEDEHITWASREDVFDRETELTITWELAPFQAPDIFGLGAAIAALVTVMAFFVVITKKDRDFEDVLVLLILVIVLIVALGAWLGTR